MLKIIIADDHAIVRSGLRQLLAGEADMKLIGEASNVADLLGLMRKQSCDVLVLDISMPGRSGLEVLGELKRKQPCPAVLMLTMHDDEQFAVRALRGGASGYLTKDGASAELIQAIRRIAAGGKYVSPGVAASLAVHFAAKAGNPPHARLSEREYAVLRRLASGKTTSEIAGELFLSPHTVSTYRARIMEKLKLKNNVELVHYALRQKMLD